MQQWDGHLSERVIHLVVHTRLIVACETPVPHMANNANDPSRGTHRLNPETFANNILAAESMLREIFVDDYHWFTPLSIVLIEEAALM